MPASGEGRFKSVTFTFKNIGPVKKAEMELGDLTIVAGRNNTGKTYLVYTLYGFLKMWHAWPGATTALPGKTAPSDSHRHVILPRILEQIAEQSEAIIAVNQDMLHRERTAIMQALTRAFTRDALASIFSSPPDRFKNASIAVSLSPDPSDPPPTEVHAQSEDISIRYDGTKIFVTTRVPTRQKMSTSEFLYNVTSLYLHFLFPELPSNPFLLSAERFGISLFYKELDFTKNQLVDLLQKIGDRRKSDRFPFLFIDQTVSRYALPVKDNIDYTRSISALRKQRSEVYDEALFNDIRKLMNGYYSASSDKIEFKSVARGEGRFVIPLHLASSSARGLSDLYFFLRHAARRNHLLIIDEPESHLDTANQILLARLLARSVRAGLKILLTTHSDYLVKEINNLIMLRSSFRNREEVMKRLKYKGDDCIDPERIRAYIATKDSLTKCQVDRFGIDMPNFDETIDRINDVANELASRLTEEA